MLESCSHKSVLNRGFALVRDAAGKVVSDPEGVPAGTVWSVEFREEKRVAVTVGEGAAPAAPPPPEAPKAQPVEDAPLKSRKSQRAVADAPQFHGRQGSLF